MFYQESVDVMVLDYYIILFVPQYEVYWPVEEETVTFIPFQLQHVSEVDHVTHIERTIKLTNAEEVNISKKPIDCTSNPCMFRCYDVQIKDKTPFNRQSI